jgi:hypothetical protein
MPAHVLDGLCKNFSASLDNGNNRSLFLIATHRAASAVLPHVRIPEQGGHGSGTIPGSIPK